jgi:RNA polymerase sigma-70 factor, ECF subfamily
MTPVAPLSLSDFDAVVRHYRPQVFSFIRHSARDREVAENLTQECFLRAYLARDSFRGEAAVGTWLNRIALNLIRDHMRSRRKSFCKEVSANSLELTKISDWIPDGRSSSEEILIVRSQLNTLWQAVGRLSSFQRTVFLLRFVDELQISEIAQSVGLNESTVKSHLYRALKTVRSLVERQYT